MTGPRKSKGLMIPTPNNSKCRTFLVAIVKSWTIAVAAIIASSL